MVSRWRRDQGLAVHSHGCTGAGAGLFLRDWHTERSFTSFRDLSPDQATICNLWRDFSSEIHWDVFRAILAATDYDSVGELLLKIPKKYSHLGQLIRPFFI